MTIFFPFQIKNKNLGIFFSLSVEVADFNFGETSSVDLEYKSFHQRLIDSIRDIMPERNRANNETEDSTLRYGPMS